MNYISRRLPVFAAPGETGSDVTSQFVGSGNASDDTATGGKPATATAPAPGEASPSIVAAPGNLPGSSMTSSDAATGDGLGAAVPAKPAPTGADAEANPPSLIERMTLEETEEKAVSTRLDVLEANAKALSDKVNGIVDAWNAHQKSAGATSNPDIAAIKVRIDHIVRAVFGSVDAI